MLGWFGFEAWICINAPDFRARSNEQEIYYENVWTAKAWMCVFYATRWYAVQANRARGFARISKRLDDIDKKMY